MDFYRKKLVTVGIYAFAAAVAYGIGAWFEYDITRHVAAIRAAEGEKTSRLAAGSRLAILRAAATKADAVAGDIAEMLPAQDGLISFPRRAGELAKAHGIEFGMTFGASVAGTTTTPGYVAFSASGKGTAENILGFVGAFEAGTGIVGIDTMRMNATSAGSYDMTIDGKVFSQ